MNTLISLKSHQSFGSSNLLKLLKRLVSSLFRGPERTRKGKIREKKEIPADNINDLKKKKKQRLEIDKCIAIVS